MKQVTERGHKVADVAARLGVSTYSLYDWIRKYGPSSGEYQAKCDQQAEIKRLQKELKRVTEERDILKKAAVSLIGQRNTLIEFICRRHKFQSFSWVRVFADRRNVFLNDSARKAASLTSGHARRSDLKHRQNVLMHVLRRSVEQATESFY